MNDKTNYQFDNPFSKSILEIWGIWKKYLWASHEFKYRSVFSEQASIEQLFTLSSGEEEKATKIIKQSMRGEYKTFYPLRTTTTGNGKSKQPNSDSGKSEQSIADSFKDEFIRRNGNGKQEGDGSHLKAV